MNDIISIIKKFTPIILIVIFIALILVGYFFVWPKLQEFTEKKREVETRDEEVKQHEKYLAKLDNALKDLLEYSDEIIKVDSALPTKASAAALFNFLQKTSSQNGLIMKDIDVSQLYVEKAEVSEQGLKKMPFSIEVTGSYSSLKDFIATIYMNSRVISIKSIDFSADIKTNEKNTIVIVKDIFDFTLNLETQSYEMTEIIKEELIN